MNILEQTDKLIADVAIVAEGTKAMKNAVVEFGTEQYNKGWDEAMAQAGTGGTSDKIYSEVEMNQIIAETKAPFEAKVAELEAKIEAVPEQILEAQKAALDGFKVMLKEEYEKQQVAESQSETGFANLLS